MVKHSIQKKILSIKNLSITLPPGSDRKYAVENASLDLNRGEILCVVGESGSGKSVMTSAILNDVPHRLVISSGEILYNGNKNIAHLKGYVMFQDKHSQLRTSEIKFNLKYKITEK